MTTALLVTQTVPEGFPVRHGTFEGGGNERHGIARHGEDGGVADCCPDVCVKNLQCTKIRKTSNRIATGGRKRTMDEHLHIKGCQVTFSQLFQFGVRDFRRREECHECNFYFHLGRRL